MDRFNVSFQSERASLKVSQLERKWQQILEEERRSCLRNQKLLEDFDRIDQQSKVFSKKSGSLKQAKYNFELYVQSVYPRWTKELKQLQEVERKKASKVIRPASLLTDKGGYKEKEYSENILNPTFSSTPNRNGVSLTERERLTNSGGLKEGNQSVMPEHRGYNQHYPSSGRYPLHHPMANLSQNNSGGWGHPEAMPYGTFPYMGHYPLPRPHYVMPWKNVNHSFEGQAGYGYDPNGTSFLEMPGNGPPWSSQKFDYQRGPVFVENFHGNSSEAREFQQAYRDQGDDRCGINQTLRNSQEHRDAGHTPHTCRDDSRSVHSKEGSDKENVEQPKTRNGSENYSELIEDGSRDKSAHEKSSVGKYAKEKDAKPKVMKYTNTEMLNRSTDLKINNKNVDGSLRREVYNPSVNHEPTGENTHCRKEEQNDKDNEEESNMSNNEIPESDIDSSLPNSPKDQGSQNKQQDLSCRPTGSAQVGEMKSANLGNSSEKEIPRKEEAKTSDVMDDLLPDDVSDFEISGSDISEHALSEHEIITSNQKKRVHVSENSTEKSGITPEMDDLEVQDDESISKPREDSVSNEHSDTEELTKIDDGKTVPNTETELLSQDKGESTNIHDPKTVADTETAPLSQDKREPTNIHAPKTVVDTETAPLSQDKRESTNIYDPKTVADTETAPLSQDKREPTNIHDPKTVADTEQDKRESFSEPREKEERNEPKENDFHLDNKDESKDSQVQEDISDDFDVSSDRHDEEKRDDENKSKSEVLEDLSFTSAEDSSSEYNSLKKKSDSKKSEKKNETKESVSYSEDFEDEKSIPLTETEAYQKMLSNVNVSDEEDTEEDLLGASTMSGGNIVGLTKQDHDNSQQSPRQQPVSQSSSISKKPAKASKSKPMLSVFSSGEGDGLEDSLGKDSEGILTWKSSELSLSPPLSPDVDLGGYVPTIVPVADKKVEGNEKKETDKKKKGAREKALTAGKEQGKVEKETGKEKQESKTRSRIQAGFWNHSDSESEVDLQVSHGPDDNGDDDDDFDFYS